MDRGTYPETREDRGAGALAGRCADGLRQSHCGGEACCTDCVSSFLSLAEQSVRPSYHRKGSKKVREGRVLTPGLGTQKMIRRKHVGSKAVETVARDPMDGRWPDHGRDRVELHRPIDAC